MKNLIYLFSILMISLTACDNELKKELETQQATLMKLHDEVMPKSMRIDKIKANLQTLSQSQNDNDSLSVLITDTSVKLQKTNDDMYTWMKNFGVAMNDVTDLDEKKKLYDELEIEIEKIKAETDEYTEKAQKLLQQ
ncbi:hypothetical protein SAMN06298216_0486 [Spirosomataceae bacterium TFI 002]|nr:hypothetical protein SAMN06298216_0486 [Spirosomataceae bacterium TFI 002]